MPPESRVLEEAAGASGKTITRIFQKETGMGYQQWRQQWRLMRAIELLATGHSITYTAGELEFSSDSVFIFVLLEECSATLPGHILTGYRQIVESITLDCRMNKLKSFY